MNDPTDPSLTESPLIQAIRILARMGVIKFNPNADGFNADSLASNRVMVPQGSVHGPLEALGMAGTQGLGLMPRTDEQTGDYWGRIYGDSLPPSLRHPVGRDIQLPAERKKAKR